MVAQKRALKPGEFAVAWVSRVVLWIIIILAIVPLLYVVTASFNPTNSFFSASLIPPHPTLANYVALFQSPFWLWMKNTIIVALIVSAAQLVMTALGAYAFSRLQFFGRRYGLMTLIILQMFPATAAVPAIYAVLAQLGLLDNLWVYILIMVGGSAFNVWLVKGYFDTIPRELDEAAIMDGAGHIRIFWQIIIPLARPMLAVIFFLSLIGVFSEYILASTILQSPQNYTFGMGLYSLITGEFAKNWGEFAAAALISAVPLTVAFAFLNPLISKGLTAGSVKG